MKEQILFLLLPMVIILILCSSCNSSVPALTDLQSWGNGGWRPAFYTNDVPHLCTGWKEMVPNWFKEIIKNTGRDDCPIPPGNYAVTAYNISFAEFNIPMWEYGKYKMINHIFKENVLVGCIGIIVESTPTGTPPKKKH
ncbi:uncharacterized protein [Halyomorpha halys]|uniref:uncharacterized protein n=1 Tax=Halyomorpha halys TaxID=286706 RepID=UPI0034D3244A